MFTRAGFNPRHQVLCYARVRIGQHFGMAQLMQWRPSGDLGWYIPGRVIAWHVDYLFTHIGIDLNLACRIGVHWSPWPRRQELAA